MLFVFVSTQKKFVIFDIFLNLAIFNLNDSYNLFFKSWAFLCTEWIFEDKKVNLI